VEVSVPPAAPSEVVRAWWKEWGDAGQRSDLSEPRAAGVALRAAHAAGVLDLPLPAHGSTAARWSGLAALGEADLTLARLGEAHADAVAILAELDGPPPPPGSLWGVWAAEPPGATVHAVLDSAGDTWRLSGRKAWCSGARIYTHALVTARSEDGPRLFALDLADTGVRPVEGGWAALALTGSDTLAVDLDDAPAVPVGRPGAYVDRPGFWHGAAGVAACWYGGARGVAATLVKAARRRDVGPHAFAHLGALDAALTAAGDGLRAASAAADAALTDTADAELNARRVRAVAEAVAADAIDRVGRALGPTPLAGDRAHARRVADLALYVRQSHAERDLADLGRLVASRTEEGARW
jgi:alkylation response protein AidB-like acyl-CoA dehydrogenase